MCEQYERLLPVVPKYLQLNSTFFPRNSKDMSEIDLGKAVGHQDPDIPVREAA